MAGEINDERLNSLNNVAWSIRHRRAARRFTGSLTLLLFASPPAALLPGYLGVALPVLTGLVGVTAPMVALLEDGGWRDRRRARAARDEWVDEAIADRKGIDAAHLIAVGADLEPTRRRGAYLVGQIETLAQRRLDEAAALTTYFVIDELSAPERRAAAQSLVAIGERHGVFDPSSLELALRKLTDDFASPGGEYAHRATETWWERWNTARAEDSNFELMAEFSARLREQLDPAVDLGPAVDDVASDLFNAPSDVERLAALIILRSQARASHSAAQRLLTIAASIEPVIPDARRLQDLWRQARADAHYTLADSTTDAALARDHRLLGDELVRGDGSRDSLS